MELKNIITEINNSHIYKWQNILFIGLGTRIILFIFTLFFPIMFGPSPPISPLHYQTGIDISEYLKNTQFYLFDRNIEYVYNIYYKIFFEWEYPPGRFLGPFYPIILYITDYKINNTLPLSILVLLTEACSYTIWCLIFREKISGILGIIFLFMPHTIWFSILISTDIFVCFFAAIYFMIIHKKFYLKIFLPIICFLLLLIKPTAIIFCIGSIFLGGEFFGNKKEERSCKILISFILLIALIFYLPYFLFDQYLIENSEELTEISRFNYDIIKISSKFFHIFGFHKSESGIFVNEVVRYIYGLFFLLGLIRIFFVEKWLRIIVFILIAFILFTHVPSWRYMLPLLPLILLNSFLSIKYLINRYLLRTSE